MQILLLYAAVVLIWGSTWSAIPCQLGTVAEEVSVASLALYAYAYFSRRPLRLPGTAFPLVFLQGALLFCINYFFVYYGTAYLTTGVVAVLFSSILILNAIFERLFFGSRIDTRFCPSPDANSSKPGSVVDSPTSCSASGITVSMIFSLLGITCGMAPSGC